jgi:predicted nuclease with TOPRIM domain
VREQTEARLAELRKEFEMGQNRLQQLAQEEARLRETMLRISGAIQVLEELTAADTPHPGATLREVAAQK